MRQGIVIAAGITPFLKGANGVYQQANPAVFLVRRFSPIAAALSALTPVNVALASRE